jgi:molybdate transport system ATP-binding protein
VTLSVSLELTAGNFSVTASFAVPARGVTGLIGASGSGKTTLLRGMAGLLRGRGEVCFRGTTWQDERVFVPPHRRSIGYVFQDGVLFDHLRVRDNLLFGWRRRPRGEQRMTVSQAVDLMGVGHLLDRRVTHLSGGERQRVAIARAVLAAPALLLLDEPMASLDRAGRREIVPYLEHLHAALDCPMVYVSHAHEEILRLADQVVVLEGGRVVACGPVEALAGRLDLPALDEGGAFTLLEGTVAGRDDAYELNRIEVRAGGIWLPGAPLKPGGRVRIQVPASGVSLAVGAPGRTSVQNNLPVVVREVETVDGARVLVRLDAGGDRLFALVTRKAADELGIHPGLSCRALIKAVSLIT